ncbi:MAG: hypothetical protein AAFP07_09215 [Cyanobacteria bacterium J06606_4]
MAFDSKKSRIFLFFAIGLGLSVLMALLKAIAAWLANTYLYSVPWIGGFLKSIELTELSNLVVFAILGAGIGSATLLLPQRWDHRAKIGFLALVSPFVFSGSYLMRQHLWIQEVAARANISYPEARDITNAYLEREVGSGGFFGFYPFSTQLAELPVRRETLESLQAANPNDLLTDELAGYDDPRADFAAFVFQRVGWLIRLMYMAIAVLVGLIYYFKGHVWAETSRRVNRRADSKPPRKPPRPPSSPPTGSSGPSAGPSSGPSSSSPSGSSAGTVPKTTPKTAPKVKRKPS